MPIFIVKNNPGFLKPIVLEKEDEHHVVHVLRSRAMDTVDMVDNGGQRVRTEIVSLKPLRFKILEKKICPQPSPITVCLPLIEQTRLEWAIEKLCELNVQTAQLISTERCQSKTLSEKKMQRLHKIALAAQKQSERAWPMEISDVVSLKKFSFDKNRQCFVGQPSALTGEPRTDTDIRELQTTNYKLQTLFVGPEGGFTPAEITFFEQQKVQSISVGQTILRTETAAVVLAALLSSPI